MKLRCIFFFMLLFGWTSLSFGQTEIEQYGCKYIKSKIKTTGFTEAELEYAEALTFRSDTFDITNYRIKLDVTNFSSKVLYGQCDIDFYPKMEGLDYIIFDLLEMSVDSVLFGSKHIDFDYNSPFLKIKFETELTKNDTLQVSVFYHGVSVIDPSGFGGFQFEKGYAYNLGIGLTSIPHNYGRSWFPCFDNFVERSTYDLDIITQAIHRAYCVGTFEGVDSFAGGEKMYHYRMSKQIPTYLVGVAVSNYKEVNWEFEGVERNFPIQLLSKPEDTTNIKLAFAYLPFAIEALEKWFGPYEWSRVGYVLTSHGAMEHPTNVAFPDFLGSSGDPEYAMGTMAHELAHHWWGDITTLTTAYDMWIKEGTSEYGKQLFIEDFFGKERFKTMLKDNQAKVLLTAHLQDDGYRALSGMPMNHTYGTTTYYKGAFVIHNLRSYMGDSLFKKGMRSILKEYAYNHIDADQFEIQLEQSTGIDLTCFFNDWIYAPGFSAFEIDSIQVSQQGNDYNLILNIEQKLHHAPHFHCDVPLEITFYDSDLNKTNRTVNISGQYSEVQLTLPFNPLFWTINENQKLNNGQIGDNKYLKPNQVLKFERIKVNLEAESLEKDSIFIRAEHVYGKPDTIYNKDLGVIMTISGTHFWNFTGEIPEVNEIKASFFYNGDSEQSLDYNLTYGNENLVQMIHKPLNSNRWELVEDFKKYKYGSKDGNGTIVITGLKPGQYTFANIEYFSKTYEISSKIELFPNPVTDLLHIAMGDKFTNIDKDIAIYSPLGDNIFSRKNVFDNELAIDVKAFQSGFYFIKITDNNDGSSMISKFVIER